MDIKEKVLNNRKNGMAMMLLFINFSWGMATGMEPLNFWLIMANGTAVIGLAVDEMEERRWKH